MTEINLAEFGKTASPQMFVLMMWLLHPVARAGKALEIFSTDHWTTVFGNIISDEGKALSITDDRPYVFMGGSFHTEVVSKIYQQRFIILRIGDKASFIEISFASRPDGSDWIQFRFDTILKDLISDDMLEKLIYDYRNQRSRWAPLLQRFLNIALGLCWFAFAIIMFFLIRSLIVAL